MFTKIVSSKSFYFLIVPLLLLMSYQVKANNNNGSQYNRAMMIQSSSIPTKQTLRLTVRELKSNSGLTYLGALVSNAQISPYLKQLTQILAKDFSLYRENQSKRDLGLFHLTIIDPNEYQFIDKAKIKVGQSYTVTLVGLGKAASGLKTAYYVVAQSSEIQFYRQQLALKNKDLHVTLGFNPQDVYDKTKGLNTLVAQ